MMPPPLFISYLDDRKVKSTTNKTKTNINSMTLKVFVLKIMKKSKNLEVLAWNKQNIRL